MAYSAGKLAVITGAGSGIGRALALRLNREGCRLLLSDINPDSLEGTVKALPRPDISVQTRVLDVADREAMHSWAEETQAEHGHIDILINNAGVALLASAEDTRYEDFEWLMGINFWGVVHGCKAFLPLLRASEQGHLVNLSSLFGLIAVPTQSAYNAAKFAVRGYTESLRHDLADSGIHVCCVHPGGIKTNIARAGRSNSPDANADERDARFQAIARTTAESAAEQIVQAIEQRKARLLIGRDAKLLALMERLFPINWHRFLPGTGEHLDELKK